MVYPGTSTALWRTKRWKNGQFLPILFFINPNGHPNPLFAFGVVPSTHSFASIPSFRLGEHFPLNPFKDRLAIFFFAIDLFDLAVPEPDSSIGASRCDEVRSKAPGVERGGGEMAGGHVAADDVDPVRQRQSRWINACWGDLQASCTRRPTRWRRRWSKATLKFAVWNASDLSFDGPTWPMKKTDDEAIILYNDMNLTILCRRQDNLPHMQIWSVLGSWTIVTALLKQDLGRKKWMLKLTYLNNASDMS